MTSEFEEHNNITATSHGAWAHSMERRYDDANESQRRTSRTDQPLIIHRVPQGIRAADEDAYEPTMLSIGPYHRSKLKLQAMEKHKWQYVKAIIRRTPELNLCYYLEQMKELEKAVRSFYSESIELESWKFVEMMLLDGCFIIELFLTFWSRFDVVADLEDLAAYSNPIHSTNWILPILCVDMLLMENQLPLLVLERILLLVRSSESSSTATPSLIDLALNFFIRNISIDGDSSREDQPINRIDRDSSREDQPINHHLLHLYHSHHSHLIRTTIDQQFPTTRAEAPIRYFPSTTDIQDSGIKLVPNLWRSILDVKFKDNVLCIPPLYINHSTNSVFRNLIALEQSCPSCGSYFTSYAVFMNCLIDMPQDVQILKRCGIIENWFGTDDQVVALFTRMCVGVSFDIEESFLWILVYQLKRSRSHLWRAFMATMVRNYFKDRMALINFQITITVTILTVVQTLLAVISYKRPNS